MDITFTKQAERDLLLFDEETKIWLREYIEKLPGGDIRKLADFSTVFRLRIADFCIVFEEKLNPKVGRQALTFNREQMLEMNAIMFIVMKIIPRPITWMQEIEAVRVGREETRKGDIKKIEDVVWK